MEQPLLCLKIKRSRLLFQSFFNGFAAIVCLVIAILSQSFLQPILMMIACLLMLSSLYNLVLTRSSCLFYESYIDLTIGFQKQRIMIQDIQAFDWQSFDTGYGVLRLHTTNNIVTLPKRLFAHLNELKVVQESLNIKNL